MTEAVTAPVEVTVLYDYADEDPTYLTIKKGQVLTVYQQKDTWWYGVARDGTKGFFPSIYVRVNTPSDAPPRPRTASQAVPGRPKSPPVRKCVAKFPFSHPHDNNFKMLTLKAGDVITILKQEEEWFEGELQTGERGYFPANHVQEIEVEESDHSAADGSDIMARLADALRLYKLDASPTPRILAAVELVETERRYVADLQIVQFALVVPLRRNTMEFEGGANKPGFKRNSLKLKLRHGENDDEALHSELILKHSQLETVFSNWESLLSVNLAFMEALQARLKLWHTLPLSGQTLGSVLLEHIPLFKMYCSYCSNFGKSQNLIAKLRVKSENFMNFLKTIQDSGVTRGRTINSYLIAPIQRVPRYIMLIAELLKCTKPDHPDYASLQQALTMVEAVAVEINESVRIKENHTLVAKLESTFLTNPRFSAQPRQLLRHGELVKKSSKKDGPERSYIFFLFDDLLAYAAVQHATQKLLLHGKLPIDENFTVDETDQDLGGKDRPFHCMIRASKNFQLFFKSEEEQIEWVLDLRRCIGQQIVRRDERQKQGLKTSSGDECSACLKKFSAMRSKFKCADCCTAVCKACSKPRDDGTSSTFKLPESKTDSWKGGDISGLGSNPLSGAMYKSRVCLSCHDFAEAQKPGKGRTLSLFGRGKKFSLLKTSYEREHKEGEQQTVAAKPLATFEYRLVNCPQKHGLSPKLALEEGYACDVCVAKTPIAIGEKMQACVPCNFYVCVACQFKPGTEVCTLGSARPGLNTLIARTQRGFLERFAEVPGVSKEAVAVAAGAEAASNVLGNFESSDDDDEIEEVNGMEVDLRLAVPPKSPSMVAPVSPTINRRAAIIRSPSQTPLQGTAPPPLSLAASAERKTAGPPRPPPRSTGSTAPVSPPSILNISVGMSLPSNTGSKPTPSPPPRTSTSPPTTGRISVTSPKLSSSTTPITPPIASKPVTGPSPPPRGDPKKVPPPPKPK